MISNALFTSIILRFYKNPKSCSHAFPLWDKTGLEIER